jgi:glycosyltransferase involved in cell wall biosynthesis
LEKLGYTIVGDRGFFCRKSSIGCGIKIGETLWFPAAILNRDCKEIGLIRLAILGTRGIPARYGGFETFAEQLSTRLAARGVEVTVFCPTLLPKSDERYRGVRLKFVRFPSLGKYSQMIWDARCFWVARRSFDTVYMLGVGGSFAAWIPRLFGARVWINSDGVEWKRSKFTWPQRAYLALAEGLSALFASRIVADASAIAEYLRERYHGLIKVSTIAYGADIPTEEPDRKLIWEWNLEPDGYYLVVCRLEPENHVREIVEGFEHSKSSLPLVVVGDVENPNTYVRTLLANRSAKVHFVGTVYDKEKLTALRFYARAYIHGHSVGGTNPSLLEAMACSNLVIAHDNPFNREVLADSGLFFETSNALASTIDAIDSREINANEMRVTASARIRARYLWDQIAEEYLQLLATV